MKKILGILILVPSILSAQTVVTVGPVTTSMRIAWALPDTYTLASAATFEYRLRDSVHAGVVTALTNVQCSGTPISCTSQLTQSNVDALNMVGVHELTLTAFRSDVGESTQSLPFLLRSPAAAPINLRVIQ